MVVHIKQKEKVGKQGLRGSHDIGGGNMRGCWRGTAGRMGKEGDCIHQGVAQLPQLLLGLRPGEGEELLLPPFILLLGLPHPCRQERKEQKSMLCARVGLVIPLTNVLQAPLPPPRCWSGWGGGAAGSRGGARFET